MIKTGLSIMLCICFSIVQGQVHKTSDVFLNHLLDQELHDNAIYYLESELNDSLTKSLSDDSLHFYLGKLYQDVNLQSSTVHFEMIDEGNSELIRERKKGLIVNYLEEDKLDKVRYIIDKPSKRLWTKTCDSTYLEYSLIVLQKKDKSFSVEACSGREWNKLHGIDSTLIKMKKKSPFVAGAMSAIVPGLGKVYVGKKKQGIMAFMTVIIIGWQAIEGYQQGGYNDPRFIIFGSIFAVNYIGNIWGSAVSASVNYQNHYYESKAAILATVRIGLDRR